MNIMVGSTAEREWILRQYPYTKQVLGEGGVLLLAEEEGSIRGFLWCFAQPVPAPVDAKEWFINVIEVFDAADRCKGIASSLVQTCIQMARQQGADQVRAYCDISNTASHRLWHKNGFGISPVKMPDNQVVGSYVTYALPRDGQ